LLALAACALLGGRADARRVVHIPTLAELCPANAEWASVAQCIRRHAKFTVIREEAQLEIIDINSDAGGYFGGVYVYRHDKQWTLRGEVRLYEQHEILAVQQATFGTSGAQRVDIGLVSPMPFAPDGENIVAQGVLRQRITAVCFDGAGGCSQLVTSCDMLLHGKAYNSFRGTLTYQNRTLGVTGDHTNEGQFCRQAGPTFAGFDED
jgi:hypothetical protein